MGVLSCGFLLWMCLCSNVQTLQLGHSVVSVARFCSSDSMETLTNIMITIISAESPRKTPYESGKNSRQMQQCSQHTLLIGGLLCHLTL